MFVMPEAQKRGWGTMIGLTIPGTDDSNPIESATSECRGQWECSALRNETEALRKYAPDLARQRYYRWLNQYHWVPLTAVGLSLFVFGGWSWLLWGAVLPVTIGFHVTWMVNSVTHLWGSRLFSTGDDSRNNLWVALLTGGEGWHNNHHAYPVSARHGLAWYEVDVNYYGIHLLETLALATHVKTVSLKSTIDETTRVLKGDASLTSTDKTFPGEAYANTGRE
jgi:stearoyl-CoA desaturase (delta-9 desaturase)